MEGLLIQGVLGWAEFKTNLHLMMDASAALGICRRQGVGSVRHLAVKCLWVQRLVQTKELTVGKVAGIYNGADAGTKVLETPRLHECM